MKICSFPAAEMLAESRRIATLADTLNGDKRLACVEFCVYVNKLRKAHEHITGCKCWYEAYQAAKFDMPQNYGTQRCSTKSK